MRLYAYVMPLCVLLMLLLRVVVLLCCGLSFGIAMPAYNRTWGYRLSALTCLSVHQHVNNL